MSATEIAISVGIPAQQFQVLDMRGVGANPFCITALGVIATRGDLCTYTTVADTVIQGTTGQGATALYAGFLDSDVVANKTGLMVTFFGDKVVAGKDKVAIWNIGRFRISNVVGVVADNVPVYPAINGGLAAVAGVAGDAVVGHCRKGNGGVSGAPIEVVINLVG